MIDWGTLQDGLTALVARLTGIATRDIAWQGRADSFVAAPLLASADLLAFANGSVGTLDELQWSEATPGGNMQQTTIGRREFTLRVKVTVYDQRPALVARTYLEMVRDRMAWDSTRDELTALGLGFQSVASLTDLTVTKDSHATSVGAIDVRFNLVSTDTDPTAYERISTVQFDPPGYS